jgi:phosphohistidine swiveling domain-containing protein
VAYRFIDGYVVTETPPLEQVRLTEENLASIAETMDPLLELYGDAALEFGVIKRSGRLVPYLIDVAEGDVAGIQLDAALINSGVLSVGVCQGHASPVRLKRHGALDRHLHDKTRAKIDKGRPVVVVAEQPSVELLPLVGAPGVVGFAFRQGSVLAHLAVVLREKGIPAIIVDDRKVFQSLSDGVPIRIDAATRSLARDGRLTLME